MSAFIVSSETIDRVLAAISWGGCNGKIPLSSPLFRPHAKLGKALLNMNYDAVCARYGEEMATEDYGTRAKCTVYKPKALSISRVQMCKSVQCLIYQCSEGDVPETELYKALDSFVAILEREIGYTSDPDAAKPAGYDAAIWD